MIRTALAVACLVLAILSPLVFLAGCAKTERTVVDPKAFTLPTTLFAVGF